MLEKGEVPKYQDQIREENKESAESNLGTSADGYSPTYVEMAKKKKPMDNYGSSMKNPLRVLQKKGINILRRFGRKKLNA